MAKRQAKEAEAAQEETFDEAMTDEERAYFESSGEAEQEQEAATEAEQEQVEEPTAEEAEAQAEAEAADAEAAEGDDDRRQRTVPIHALHEEREERKRFQSELQREREERMADRARFEERFKIIQERLQPQQAQQPEAIPDPNEDPMGALAWTQAQLRQFAEERQRSEAQTAEQRRQSEEWNRVYNDAVREWQGYVQENPQAEDAYNYLLESKAREYAAYNLSMPQIQQVLQQDEAKAIVYARQHGLPLSRVVVGMAQARGWAPTPAQEQPQTRQPDAAKAIATTQRGQNAARTLSGGGGSPDAPLSLEALLEMDETEFGKAIAKLSPSEERRLFGG